MVDTDEDDEEEGSMAVANERMVSTEERAASGMDVPLVRPEDRAVTSGPDEPLVRPETLPFALCPVDPLTFVLPVWVEPLL